jgi:hypothetical protein
MRWPSWRSRSWRAAARRSRPVSATCSTSTSTRRALPRRRQRRPLPRRRRHRDRRRDRAPARLRLQPGLHPRGRWRRGAERGPEDAPDPAGDPPRAAGRATAAVSSRAASTAASSMATTSSTGRTAARHRLANLVTLCRGHHRLVHEGGYGVIAAARAGSSSRDPGGRVLRCRTVAAVIRGEAALRSCRAPAARASGSALRDHPVARLVRRARGLVVGRREPADARRSGRLVKHLLYKIVKQLLYSFCKA